MSVTRQVFHVLMCPWSTSAVAGSDTQRATALRSPSLSKSVVNRLQGQALYAVLPKLKLIVPLMVLVQSPSSTCAVESAGHEGRRKRIAR